MINAVVQIPTTDPAVYAFRVTGEIDTHGMSEMAGVMNTAFDDHDRVRMLLIFERFDGTSLGARFSFEGLKAQLRGLSKIKKYAVVGAPDDAEKVIETTKNWTGVETATFDSHEEAAAWGFVGAEVPDAA